MLQSRPIKQGKVSHCGLVHDLWIATGFYAEPSPVAGFLPTALRQFASTFAELGSAAEVGQRKFQAEVAKQIEGSITALSLGSNLG